MHAYQVFYPTGAVLRITARSLYTACCFAYASGRECWVRPLRPTEGEHIAFVAQNFERGSHVTYR
jgi:hypothetical protein